MADKKKILVADDDEAFRLLMSNELSSKENISVLQAKSGDEALALTLKEHPNLVLLDIMMEPGRGTDVLKKLRTDAWGKTVPVFMLTQLSDMEKIAETAEQNIKGYFIKSELSIEQICDRVLKALNDA